MKLILKRRPSGIDRFAPFARCRRIPALDDETGHEAVEQGAVVVAIEAVLEEVAAGEGGLLGEELEEEIAGCGC